MEVHTIRPSRVLATLSLMALACGTHAQTALLRKADRLYKDYSFAQAINWYERAFEAGAQDLGAARRLADSYRRVRDLGSSEKWYSIIVGAEEADSTDLFNYADALRANAKYAKADSVLHLYSARYPGDSRVPQLANSAKSFGLLIVDPFIEGHVTPTGLNSEAVDMSPALMGDKLVFASSRKVEGTVERIHAWDDKPFMNLYVLDSTGIRLLKGSVNTRYHESNATFSADGTEMFFTRNGFLDGRTEEGRDGFNNLHIYSARLVKGQWTDEKAFPYNDASFSTGHPSLSSDGRTLYFASDRPGGYGGVDIWRCIRDESGQWSAPINMGATVNTEGNEMFPSEHGQRGLFFSSDGHGGLGGLDIFLTWIYDGVARAPKNLGAPINSRADDMSFVLKSDDYTGFFSSDRNGPQGADIFRVLLEEPLQQHTLIKGRIVSAKNGAPLERIPVRLTRPDRTIIAQLLSAPDGHFEFTAPPRPVLVIAGLSGAAEQELPIDEYTLQMADGELELKDISVPTAFDLPVSLRVLDKATGLPVPGVNVEMFDSTSQRCIMQGHTDDYGDASTALRDVNLGEHHQLRLKLSYADQPVATARFDLQVEGNTPQRLEQHFDLGRYTAVAVMQPIKNRLVMLDNSSEEAGAEWAGRVIDRKDAQPVARVPVALLDVRGVEIARTLTDVEGRYRLRSAEVPFSIRATLPGNDTVIVSDISPFGNDEMEDLKVNSVMDLPVNALVRDALSGEAIAEVNITVIDRRDGQLLFQGTTNANGVCMGEIPDRRFGTDQLFDVTFHKEGYQTTTVPVDISVLAFLEQALGGAKGFRMLPDLRGVDLGQAMRLQPILFDYNSADIRDDAKGDLDLVARVMQLDTTIRIDLRSHTDCRGSNAFNQFLSVRRAESTRAYLVQQGIEARRLRAFGVGERELVNHCTDGMECSELEHQDNRRTEFMVTDCQSCRLAQKTGR